MQRTARCMHWQTPSLTRAVSVPKWVKTTYAVDAVVAIILVAWEICAIRKYRKAKKEDEDTEQ